MPLKSLKQERYLWAKKPGLAREFENATPAGAKLPLYAPKKPRKGGGLVK